MAATSVLIEGSAFSGPSRPELLSDRLPIFPETSRVDSTNQLVIGGVNAVDLVTEYGTPLYVFDDETLRNQCRRFKEEFGVIYPEVRVSYACKALMLKPLARLLAQEGMGLDVVSAGEMAVARAVGYPPKGVYFHGNNKGPEELALGLEWNIGCVVVDNFHELQLLNVIAGEKGKIQDVLLRISPGVDPHTHSHTTTGILDSKFGFAVANGQAEEAVRKAQAAPNLQLIGIHVHLGSPIFELEPFAGGIRVAMDFAMEMRKRHGLELREFSPGGGFAIQYTSSRPAPPVSAYAKTIVDALRRACDQHGFELPCLVVEPGRAIVGRAGVALYSVGARKDIPGVRTYVSVDGGMGDNIRPAIYDASYEALVAGRVNSEELETVTIAGKYCESGDLLIKNIDLPPLVAGDVVAIPASGAYCIPMGSNYNSAPKPAVVLVKQGETTVWRRRETFADIMQTEA